MVLALCQQGWIVLHGRVLIRHDSTLGCGCEGEALGDEEARFGQVKDG
jgi:hypothetical protein